MRLIGDVSASLWADGCADYTGSLLWTSVSRGKLFNFCCASHLNYAVYLSFNVNLLALTKPISAQCREQLCLTRAGMWLGLRVQIR